MAMKCLNHRYVNAVGQCSNCGVAICEVCNRSEDEEVLMCEACSMLSTFTTMRKRKKDIDEKRSEKELEDTSKKIKRRSVILAASIVFTLIIIIIEVIWYISLTRTDNSEPEPLDDYFTATIIMSNAIASYREDHEGEIPESMEDLLGTYLPDNEIWKKFIQEYHYAKKTPDKYELMPPLINDGIPDIVISDEGLAIVGF